jgi:hypothetical protein
MRIANYRFSFSRSRTAPLRALFSITTEPDRSWQPVLIFAAACFGLAAMAFPLAAQEDPGSMEQRLKVDLDYLAADEREGRGVGTDGLQEAGEMIAQRFAELGLKTDLFGDQPFQDFTITDGFEAAMPDSPDQAPKNRLNISGQHSADLEFGVQWMPLSLGSNGEFSGELVFVGYGISAPDLEYDDYADIDVAGKVVVVIRKQPFQAKEDGKFGNARSSRNAYFSTKESTAAGKGAAAMILVNDFMTVDNDDGDRLFSVSDGGRAIGSETIPTMHVLRDAIDPILQQALGKSLRELEALIDESGQPASQPLTGVVAAGATEIQRRQAPVRNVIGLLPGAGALADEYVVVGAHYDHVGLGGPGSLAPGTIAVHNGADDNGSGTAALLEIARQLSQDSSPDRRNILFMAFTAEERGLLGSKHYVKYPLFPLEKTVAMINLDMVGRLHDGSLTVYGTGTAVEFPGLLSELADPLALELNQQAAGYGPSDHQSFHEVGIPVMHFFTGLHNQYHRPTDDVDLIDFPGLTKITSFGAELTRRIATEKTPPTRLKNESRARIGPNPGRRRAVLGVNLDASSQQCVVSAISPESAAEKAGILVGDVIVQIDDRNIEGTDDLLQAMQFYRVDDEVTVKVLREQESLELKVKLGAE